MALPRCSSVRTQLGLTVFQGYETADMATRVVIVDYGSGNLRSVAKAFERAAREDNQAIDLKISAHADDIAKADRIVLPGVGAFAACRAGLATLPGMIEALENAVINRARPFLGICVGMQLLATLGEEHGVHRGFGWISGRVVALNANGDDHPDELPGGRRVPHMGWNALKIAQRAHPLLAGLADGANVYFVHSYQFMPDDITNVLATTNYGDHITAVICRDNVAGTQFHPEKSQQLGLLMITNFLKWQP